MRLVPRRQCSRVAALTVARRRAGVRPRLGGEGSPARRERRQGRHGPLRRRRPAAPTVKVSSTGVTVGLDAFHGLHIHANDGRAGRATRRRRRSPTSAAHWKPDGGHHGHHEGDLPSLLVQADGTGRRAPVTAGSSRELAGRAVILHAGPDNLANVPIATPPVRRPSPGPTPPRTGPATPAAASPAGSSS